MTEPARIIHLSTLAALCIPLLFLLPAALIIVIARRNKSAKDTASGPDWSIPSVDAYADRNSFFHRWDPAVKIASLLCCCFLVASLKTLAFSGLALSLAVLAVFFCRIPWRRGLRRLAAISAFLAMFLVVLPFTSPARAGEVLIILPFLDSLPFHLDGLRLAATIILKACAIALLMEPMLGTSPLSATMRGLSRLGIPGSIVQMILLSHRYIFVFQQEITRMYRSMRVRGFIPRTDVATLRTMGNFFGMLFIGSFDRTQKIYDAMLCRGYSGTFPSFDLQKATGKDLAKGVLCCMIGVSLFTLERLGCTFTF